MDLHLLADGLLRYVLFIPLLTFHEWAHAWVAWKCGDDTAYERGRVSFNPLVHMEFIGTVVLPLMGIFMSITGAGIGIIGWGKPVPVNITNLSKPRLQDSLIAMAGPAMNLLLAIPLLALTKIAVLAGQHDVAELLAMTAEISLFLCFFNLFPIPPLDGSHLLAHLIRLPWETYLRLCAMGLFLVFIFVQFRAPMILLYTVVQTVFEGMARMFGL